MARTKEQIAEYQREWRRNNSERLNARRNEKRAAHRDEIKAANRQQYAFDRKLREKISAAGKDYRQRHQDEVKRKKKVWQQSEAGRKSQRKNYYKYRANKITAAAAYREAHKEEMKIYHRRHYAECREEILAKRKQYHEENRVAIRRKQREAQQQWTRQKRDEINSSHEQWRKNNIARSRASALHYYYNHKEARQEKQREYEAGSGAVRRREWKAANREHLNEWSRDYYAKNRKLRLAYLNEWKHGAPRFLAIIKKWKRAGGLCYICGIELPQDKITIDHVHPQKHGGVNHISNLMPAHKSCNSKKNAKLDYPVARPDLLEVSV